MKFIEKLGILPVILVAVCIFMIATVRRHPVLPMAAKAETAESSSVMSYGATAPAAAPNGTPATCYSQSQYAEQLAQGRKKQLHLSGTATQADGHRLEIYSDAGAGFIILSVGADRSGQFEACQVASGQDFQLIATAQTVPQVTPQTALAPAPR